MAELPIRKLLISGILAIAAAALFAGTASAATGITSFSAEPTTTQAGGHPDLIVRSSWLGRDDAPKDPCECDDGRILSFHYPTGFIGNPHALPICTQTEFNLANCPEAAQIGVVYVGVFGEFVPLYNLEPHPDQAGLVGFTIPITGAAALIELSGRTESDYGLDTTSAPIFHLGPLGELDFTIWGVPADPSHDLLRFRTPLVGIGTCGGGFGGPCQAPTTDTVSPVPPAPYLQNPTTCGVPLTASMDLTYYNGDEHHADSPWPATTGCQQLGFNPSLTVTPTTTQADSPSGIDIELRVPQPQSATTPSPSEIRAVTLTLPQGFSINPNAADGKLTCSDAQTSIGTREPARCPEFAKIGTVSIDNSALPGPIEGGMYLGEPKSGDRYRLILTASGFATHAKLASTVTADPETGQLVSRFTDLPQTPVQGLDMHFFGSERGLLATPTRCGTYVVKSEFVPWNSDLPAQTSTSSFTIDSGPGGGPCPQGPRPFTPEFSAGSVNSTAGMHAPFALRVDREDGEQGVAGITLKTPSGFSATLKGLSYCPESGIERLSSAGHIGLAEQFIPSCPQSSRVGSALAGAGAGSRPLHVPGDVYLAGPYKGAPLSLLAVVPAVSGPYDLGNVAVRVALHVDPNSAQVTAIADPLPQILEGIPLRTRTIQVVLDRSGFTLNPTNCDPSSVDASLSGDEGAATARSALFQVANCADLPYAPSLSLRLTGGLKRRGHPAIHAVLKAKRGEANSRRISVTLPKGELLDNSQIGAVCTKVAFARDACPASSRLGRVVAISPLLDAPLSGSIYLRSSSNELPDLALDLEGQFEIEASARIDSINERLRATFETIPDVPISQITVDLLGGSKGLLENSESLCGSAKKAVVRMRGQNGVRLNRKVKLQAACGAQRKGAR